MDKYKKCNYIEPYVSYIQFLGICKDAFYISVIFA